MSPRKKPAAPEEPIVPRIGDKVKMKASDSVRVISKVYTECDEVDLEVPVLISNGSASEPTR
jgi:hypothetical protein